MYRKVVLIGNQEKVESHRKLVLIGYQAKVELHRNVVKGNEKEVKAHPEASWILEAKSLKKHHDRLMIWYQEQVPRFFSWKNSTLNATIHSVMFPFQLLFNPQNSQLVIIGLD